MQVRRVFGAYRDLIGIIWAEAPGMVAVTFALTVLTGLLTPFGVYVNRNVFDGGLMVARGEMAFSAYAVFLVLFVLLAILPTLIEGYVYTYVEKRSLLILRTAYKSRMLQKLRTMKYEHFENEASRRSSTRRITGWRIRPVTCGRCTCIGAAVP